MKYLKQRILHKIKVSYWIFRGLKLATSRLVVCKTSFYLFYYLLKLAFSFLLSQSEAAPLCLLMILPGKITFTFLDEDPENNNLLLNVLLCYFPGDWVFVKIPAIAKSEWHPFTISSAPEQQDFFTLHIRGINVWIRLDKCEASQFLKQFKIYFAQ